MTVKVADLDTDSPPCRGHTINRARSNRTCATPKLAYPHLAGVATWERDIMLERKREGIAAAKAEGRYKGRPVSIDAAKVKQLSATMGPAAVAKRLRIARSSVYRLLDK